MNPTLKRHQDTRDHFENHLQISLAALMNGDGNSMLATRCQNTGFSIQIDSLYSNKKVLERKEVMVRVSIFIVPKVSNIKIDRLSITLPILSKAEHDYIVKCFAYNGKFSNWGEIGASKKYKTYYAHPVVGENPEITMYLQYPKNYWVTNTLKIEFNPSKVKMADVRVLINQIMINGFERFIQFGRITRLDLACDISRIMPHHIFFYAPNFSITDCKYKSGNIQTAYLGDSESDNQWAIYDKVAEIKDKNKKKEFKVEVPDHNLTRVEFRHRPSAKLMLKEILTIKNPFATLKLIAYPKSAITNDTVFNQLLTNSIFIGMNQALLKIVKHQRPKYNKMLTESGKTFWFKPEVIWESFSSSVFQVVHPYEALLTPP